MSKRVCFQVTLLAGLTGCLRGGYEPVASEPVAPRDAGKVLPPEDGATLVDADTREPDPKDAGARADSGLIDAGSFTDAGSVTDAGSIIDSGNFTDAGSLIDSGVQDSGLDAGTDAGTMPCSGAVNACGGCGVLTAVPDGACGACGLGYYVCDGTEALSCVGGTATPTTSGGALLLDHFDDGDSLFRAGAVNGHWYVVSDNTSGVLNPPQGAALVPTSPGAKNSTGAMHVSGSGFSDWGAGLQGVLNLNGCFVSAAAQSGIGFYARGTGTVLLSVATRQTVPTSDGGSCTESCYDNFMMSFQLTSLWKYHTAPWSMLRQSGWGTPTTFQPGHLKYLQFSFAAGSSMDLYLDEVSLY